MEGVGQCSLEHQPETGSLSKGKGLHIYAHVVIPNSFSFGFLSLEGQGRNMAQEQKSERNAQQNGTEHGAENRTTPNGADRGTERNTERGTERNDAERCEIPPYISNAMYWTTSALNTIFCVRVLTCGCIYREIIMPAERSGKSRVRCFNVLLVHIFLAREAPV